MNTSTARYNVTISRGSKRLSTQGFGTDLAAARAEAADAAAIYARNARGVVWVRVCEWASGAVVVELRCDRNGVKICK